MHKHEMTADSTLNFSQRSATGTPIVIILVSFESLFCAAPFAPLCRGSYPERTPPRVQNEHHRGGTTAYDRMGRLLKTSAGSDLPREMPQSGLINWRLFLILLSFQPIFMSLASFTCLFHHVKTIGLPLLAWQLRWPIEALFSCQAPKIEVGNDMKEVYKQSQIHQSW